MTREAVFENEILRGVVGSTCHGTAIDGQDDRDEMGIFIESAENVCGLTPLDHYIYRDKPEGVRSEAGDLDLFVCILNQWPCRVFKFAGALGVMCNGDAIFGKPKASFHQLTANENGIVVGFRR